MTNGKPSANRSRTLRYTLAFAFAALLPCEWTQAQSTAQTTAVQPARAGTLERVRAKGTLVLGYYTQAQPMSYRDSSGNAAGYAVMLCRQVADAVKVELGRQQLDVAWVPLTPATGLQAVQQGKVDLLCGSEPASLAKRTVVSFSTPILPGGISVLLRADAPKALQDALNERPAPYRAVWRASPFSPVQRKTLSVVSGTQAVNWVKDRMSKLHLIAKIDTIDSYDTGAAKVARGESDALFGDRAVLLALAKRSTGAGKLRVLPRHFTYEPLALALARNDDDFRLVVDRALSRFYASPKFGDAYKAVFGSVDVDTVEYFRGVPQ